MFVRRSKDLMKSIGSSDWLIDSSLNMSSWARLVASQPILSLTHQSQLAGCNTMTDSIIVHVQLVPLGLEVFMWRFSFFSLLFHIHWNGYFLISFMVWFLWTTIIKSLRVLGSGRYRVLNYKYILSHWYVFFLLYNNIRDLNINWNSIKIIYFQA